tara:strand:- start:299 stop:841 length:543 start_codon:yes stop_codon:yes gene_type:complete
VNKADIKAQLTELGVWDKYLTRRDKLKEEGLEPKEAAAKAYEEVLSLQPGKRSELPKKAAPCPYAELSLSAPPGSCTEREAANFVFEYAAVPVGSIPRSAVPSKGAVGLLKWVQTSPSNSATFYSSIWSKLMPTRQQLDAEARFSDDGREELEILSRLEASLEPEETQVQVPSVPEGSAE